MEVVFTSQEHIHSNFKNAFISYFRVFDNLDKPDGEIIMELIKNKTFEIERAPEIAKDRNREGFSEVGYLKVGFLLPAFQYSILHLEHFKQFSRQQLYDFLDNYYLNGKEWGDDRQDYVTTVAWLKKDIDNCSSDLFFVISMDWFGENDTIINKPEQWIYGYFITILWIDRENYLISSCELSAD